MNICIVLNKLVLRKTADCCVVFFSLSKVRFRNGCKALLLSVGGSSSSRVLRNAGGAGLRVEWRPSLLLGPSLTGGAVLLRSV